MERVKLEARVRDTSSKSNLKQLRKAGLVAGSVYGHGSESIAIALEMGALAEAVRTEAGLHALMDLSIDGASKKDGGVVVIKKVQKDPVSRKVLHVDFQRVLMTEKLTTDVPIQLIGSAVGAREGGVVEHVMHSINVRCLPDHIPSHFDVDISDLEIGHALHVGDLPVPEGVEALAQPDEVVVAVRQPTIHVEVGAEEAEEEAVEGEAAPEAEAPAAEGE